MTHQSFKKQVMVKQDLRNFQTLEHITFSLKILCLALTPKHLPLKHLQFARIKVILSTIIILSSNLPKDKLSHNPSLHRWDTHLAYPAPLHQVPLAILENFYTNRGYTPVPQLLFPRHFKLRPNIAPCHSRFKHKFTNGPNSINQPRRWVSYCCSSCLSI